MHCCHPRSLLTQNHNRDPKMKPQQALSTVNGQRLASLASHTSVPTAILQLSRQYFRAIYPGTLQALFYEKHLDIK